MFFVFNVINSWMVVLMMCLGLFLGWKVIFILLCYFILEGFMIICVSKRKKFINKLFSMMYMKWDMCIVWLIYWYINIEIEIKFVLFVFLLRWFKNESIFFCIIFFIFFLDDSFMIFSFVLFGILYWREILYVKVRVVG